MRDSLDILAGLPSIQEAEIDDNPRLYGLMASMLRNNPQLFNLYVGYEDGSFLEMDVDRPGQARLPGELERRRGCRFPAGRDLPHRQCHCARHAVPVREPDPGCGGRRVRPSYDPRQRPWYVEAFKDDKTLLTGPYIFYATGEPGYTLRTPLKEGRRGVVAGDMLLNRSGGHAGRAEARPIRTGVPVQRCRAHRRPSRDEPPDGRRCRAERRLPEIGAIRLPGWRRSIQVLAEGRPAQQFFADAAGRTYVAAFHALETAGPANIRLAVIAPLDEFFSKIIAERRTLFALALGFVVATLPFAFWLGSLMARSLRKLARQTDEIQRFEIAERPRVHSVITEIDELGRSVFTMRTVVRNFSSFIPRQIVRQLIESGASLELGGSRREVTVLFTDVADFTAKTEKADPSQVMIYTSRYFAVLSEEIMRHQGTVDKFIGDAVMAFWNAPADDPDHAVQCLPRRPGMLAQERRN